MPRCPNCQEIVPVGSNCIVDDSDCFTITGDGNMDGYGSPYVVEPILSADGNQLLTCTVNGLFGEIPILLREPPAARAYSTVPISIANNTLTTLSFSDDAYDTDTMWASGNPSRLTFTTAGVYVVTVNLLWQKHTAGDRLAQVRANGTDILLQDTKQAGGEDLRIGHSLCLEESFAAADYIEVRVQQTSGGNLYIQSDSMSPFLAACRVAPQ